MAQQTVPRRNYRSLYSGILPVAVGAVSGLVLLGAISLGQGDNGNQLGTSVVAGAGAPADNTARVVVSLPPGSRAARTSAGHGKSGFLLPPNPAAAEVTRRLESGLPLRNPAPAPVVPEQPVDDRPMIALVMDDMGFDRISSAQAVDLPAAVTLSYLPDAPDVARQVRDARKKGHTVMLHLPMEARDHNGRPGRNVLALSDSEPVLRKRLTRLLNRFDGYIGVNNHMGSRFTRNPAQMKIVLTELRRRGLFFLDSRTSGASIGGRAAHALKVPYAVRDVFIDHDREPHKIRRRFAETERIARKTGQAIAIAHPRPTTMKLLGPWVRSLADRGFRLVPVTELLERPAANKLAQLQSAE